ncbi:hypothetical protein OUZ56_011402 [Daphnia magna]|uniref:Uncharacterized protein n=1 Tax=Daphnia magna TaxID=35525 RepID=A0ABQ9Z013_9CRUS|nr:hypothetical protein OUZ56_011402 [Daphnia magna]
MEKVEMALKDDCESHYNTRIRLVTSKFGDGYMVQLSPDMFQEADEDNVEHVQHVESHQSEVDPPLYSCNKGQPESDSSSSQNQDVNHQIESLTKRNDELKIENGLLYTTIQELNKEINDLKQELRQTNATSKSSQGKRNRTSDDELQVMRVHI